LIGLGKVAMPFQSRVTQVSHTDSMPSYRRLQQYALAISVLSILYNGAEGGVSIGLGAEASSRSLVFFGAQSAIEVISACIVVWRFSSVAKPGEERARTLSPRELKYACLGSLLCRSFERI
jgi:hypothetical protein